MTNEPQSHTTGSSRATNQPPTANRPSATTAATATSSPKADRSSQRGLLAGIACYAIWGAMPVFFAALGKATPVEIIAHRVMWSLVFCFLLLTLMKQWPKFVRAIRDISIVRTLSIATVLILANWLTYVFAVSTEHVLDASLGYYINPLVTVILAVVVMREKVVPLTWVALGFGAAAVVVMTAGMGRLPWISLVLAFSFGFYGLIKSRIGGRVDSLTSLTIETLIATPFALAFVLWLSSRGESSFANGDTTHSLLLIASGIITALPLIFFGYAAQNLPLSALGMLQYLGPTIQFVLALLVFKEPMPLARWVGFGLVWVAIMLAAFGAAQRSRSVPDARD